MKESKVVSHTQSLCPVCMKKLEADIVQDGNDYVLKKICPEHGNFETVVWKDNVPMETWKLSKERAHIENPITEISQGCPYDCGLCAMHRQHTCTALIEVTSRCNLNCRFCFANSNMQGESDPSLEQLNVLYESVRKNSRNCNIQLSGGEPTIRDDLPLIIQNGKKYGFDFIQINTNGIRLAEDEEYVGKLKAAGLDSIFLQFDGTNDSIFTALRGQNLLELKTRAIENCKKYGVGVVLVPTLVPGVNVEDIGGIIEFALEHIKAVRGVHFQPVSYFGRIPCAPEDRDRITLPELMTEIEKQTNGKIPASSLKPSQCENSFCSFHGRYLYQQGGGLLILSSDSCACVKKADEGAEKSKMYVSGNWSTRKSVLSKEKSDSWDKILENINRSSFSISAMAFQDVWNVDLNRVMECCIHVVSPDKRLIPFCLYNLTDMNGNALYREHGLEQK